MGPPLIRMDADDYYRCRIAAIFWVPSIFTLPVIFFMMAIIPAAAMAWENTAGGGE